MRAPELAVYPERVRAQAARAAVARLRDRGASAAFEDYVAEAAEEGERLARPSLQIALNASGVVLHTGLGRARLAPSVATRVAAIANGHGLVEFDPETGKRGDRQEHVRGLLRELSGAEDALVVNNCAAAVFLSLSALCSGRGVVLSRGEMVEIGGSFRMPDIVRQSGCRLVEVGCTNKTRLADYAAEMGDDAAAILRCHPSNFKIVGFTEAPWIGDLAELAHRHGALLIDDAGSGCFLNTARFGLPPEPRIQDSVAAGSDLVLCSGDKLLGGPQAGIMLGRAEPIATIRRHPLARALRIDKLSLAGLEATLRLYAEGRELELPVWSAIARPLSDVKRDAQRLSRAYRGTAIVEVGATEIGGGSLPGSAVPTWRVGIPTWRVGIRDRNPEDLAATLRRHTPPIVGRIEDGTFWLDPRTLDASEVRSVATALSQVACEHA